MRILQDVAIPMRDGVELAADIHLPDSDNGNRYPCLLQRVPYDRRSPGILNGALDVARAVRRGYAVVQQDCRGRYAAKGEFVPFVNEADDGEDTIAWIRAQPWSAGTVGMFGRSYSGQLQWAVAARAPAGLRAIAPMTSGVDPALDWFGGAAAFEWGFALLWSVRHLAPDLLARGGCPIGTDALLRAMDQIGELMMEPAGERLLDSVRDVLPFLAEWTDPARRAATFAQLSSCYSAPERIAVPALVVGGWFDIFLRGSLRAFRAGAGQAAPRALVVGPWAHGSAYSGAFPERDFGIRAGADAIGLSDIQLDWFDRWLRGAAPGAGPATSPDRPVAHWFHMRANEWRTGPTWPPTAVRWCEWHLTNGDGATAGGSTADGGGATPGGALRDAPGARAQTMLAYDEEDPAPTTGGNTFLPGLEVAANSGPRDQRRLIGTRHTATFVGDPLPADLDVIGSIQCRLTVQTDVGGQLVVIRLVELDEHGTAMLVSDGAAHLPGTAGVAEPASLEIELNPTSYRFAAGNRIGLMVGSSSVPRYRRGISGERPAGRSGSWRLLHGDAASVLRMQVCPL